MKKMEILKAVESLTEWYKSKDYIFDIEEFREYIFSIKNYRKRLATVTLARLILFGSKTMYDIYVIAVLYDIVETKRYYKNTKRKLKNKEKMFVAYVKEEKYKTVELF